jgi:hypothetical protein
MKHILLLGISLLLFGHSHGAVLLSVDNSGQLKGVSTTQSLTWNFSWSGNTSYSFDRALFQVSLDNSIDPSKELVMKIYSGFGGNLPGNSVANIGGQPTVSVVTAGQVSALPGGGFKSVDFIFPASGTLAAGNYSVQLTSDAIAGTDFNVKVNALKLYDSDGTTQTELAPSEYTTDGNTTGESIPEPSTLFLSVIGALGLLRRRRA